MATYQQGELQTLQWCGENIKKKFKKRKKRKLSECMMCNVTFKYGQQSDFQSDNLSMNRMFKFDKTESYKCNSKKIIILCPRINYKQFERFYVVLLSSITNNFKGLFRVKQPCATTKNLMNITIQVTDQQMSCQ